MGNIKLPKTLQEAIIYFSDPDRALQLAIMLRWPDGIQCPRCGHDQHSFISTRRIWYCKGCKKQFTIKIGTIFEDSPLGIDKWMAAVWLTVNCKNGISSYEVARDLGVTQKSAWHMVHRIRLALQRGSFDKLSGHVEVDETYIGGKARNMHKTALAKRVAQFATPRTGRNQTTGKVAVMGLLERHGEIRTMVVAGTKRSHLHSQVTKHVEAGSNVYTDALRSYNELDREYIHGVINHAEKYVDGLVHTNGVENFWSLLKRSIKGTYVSVEPFHLFRYLDEQTFRFNTRKGTDADRFVDAMSNISNKRLTWDEVTGKTRSDN